MVTNRPDINAVLTQMREMQALVQQQPVSPTGAEGNTIGEGGPAKPDFGNMLKNAVDSVNEVQQQSGALATAYQKGDPEVSLSQVMVASQKASVSFQATMEVRNKLVEAYKEIMSMPI